jgi:hypothetical protein
MYVWLDDDVGIGQSSCPQVVDHYVIFLLLYYAW